MTQVVKIEVANFVMKRSHITRQMVKILMARHHPVYKSTIHR